VAEIVRRNTGLTNAHVELIRLLARVAVEDYLSESEPAEEAVQTSDHDEVAR